MDEVDLIKLFFLDVDGTLTKGEIFVSDHGELFKQFNVKDGLGISYFLPQFNIVPVVITGRKSKALERRCEELGITEIYQGSNNKREIMMNIVRQQGITLEQCAYIGDDINDLECIKEIKNNGGITACPLDANYQIKSLCDYVSTFKGGEGAVRDFIDYLICNEFAKQS